MGAVSRGWIRYVFLSDIIQEGLCQRGAGAQLRLCGIHALCGTSSEPLLEPSFGGDVSPQPPHSSPFMSPPARHSGGLSVPTHELPPTGWSPPTPFPLLELLCSLTFLSHTSSTLLILWVSDRVSSGHHSRAGAPWDRFSP